MFLPASGHFDLAATVRARGALGLAPYVWQHGRRPVLRRAERTADGRVHLVEVRETPGGVQLRVSGVRAAQVEVLAPIAARMRRALCLDDDGSSSSRRRSPSPVAAAGRALRGTSLFEDLVMAALHAGGTSSGPEIHVRRLLALGSRCPRAPHLRAFPNPSDLSALPIRILDHAVGSRDRALMLRTLSHHVIAARELPATSTTASRRRPPTRAAHS